MPKILKGITFSSTMAIASGVVGYFIVVLWLIAQGSSDSAEMVDTIRSKQAMYWSLPYTLVCMAISIYLPSRKLLSGHYLVALGTVILVGLSIHSGPLRIVTIHMNHLPIVIGALVGALFASKLNKSSQQDAQKSRANAGVMQNQS